MSEAKITETLFQAICDYRFPNALALDHAVVHHLTREAEAYAKAILASLPAQEWQHISTHGPWDGQPYRQFVRIEGSRDHHGANWARVYCGEAFVRPPDAEDGMLGYRREDIIRLCQHGDIDLHTAKVTHWMPATFPPVAVIADDRTGEKP